MLRGGGIDRSIHKFAKRYAPYNHEPAFWQGWHTGRDVLWCPYEKDTPKATAWHLGNEAREDWEGQSNVEE